MRFKSSAMVFLANSRKPSSADAALSVYGAWAKIEVILFSVAKFIYFSTSLGLMSLAFPPLGLRVKNWKVLALMDTEGNCRYELCSRMGEVSKI